MFKLEAYRLEAILVLLAVVLFLVAVFPPGVKSESGFGEDKLKVGEKAPDFTTQDLEGKEITLSSYNGSKVVLLNFWGVRCGACLEEMPHLDNIAKKYSGQDVVVLGVDTDGLDASTLGETMKEMGTSVDYPILVDQDFTITDTYTNFLVPLTLVIDKERVIRYIHTGYEKGREKEYEEAVRKALGS